MSVPAVHFAQPAVDLLLDIVDLQPHLLLVGFQLALQLLDLRLTVAPIGWCLEIAQWSARYNTVH